MRRSWASIVFIENTSIAVLWLRTTLYGVGLCSGPDHVHLMRVNVLGEVDQVGQRRSGRSPQAWTVRPDALIVHSIGQALALTTDNDASFCRRPSRGFDQRRYAISRDQWLDDDAVEPRHLQRCVAFGHAVPGQRNHADPAIRTGEAADRPDNVEPGRTVAIQSKVKQHETEGFPGGTPHRRCGLGDEHRIVAMTLQERACRLAGYFVILHDEDAQSRIWA